MNTIIELQKILNSMNSLWEHGSGYDSPDFKAWITRVESFILEQYGAGTPEYTAFHKCKIVPYTSNLSMTSAEYDELNRDSFLTLKEHLMMYMDRMQIQETECVDKSQVQTCLNYNKVFIVHGHDGELKHAVARTIEKQGLQAIILSEQANKGKTIIEKFEEHSDVGGAICLFTADDVGKAAKTKATEQPRARQNVVFEAGYFMGKLGRDHVVMVCEDGIEIPSDLSGVVYTGKNNWEFDMLKELKAMGYVIDLNKLCE